MVNINKSITSKELIPNFHNLSENNVGLTTNNNIWVCINDTNYVVYHKGLKINKDSKPTPTSLIEKKAINDDDVFDKIIRIIEKND